MNMKNQLCADFAFPDVTWKKHQVRSQMWGSFSKEGIFIIYREDYDLQLMVLHGAAPHSRAMKPRCGWIQQLGQHGNRNSGRTGLLSVSDHLVQ